MAISKKIRDVLPVFFIYAVLAVLTIIFFYPLLHVIMSSFSDPIKLMAHRGLMLWPAGFSLDGYRVVMQNPNILIGYKNTIFYVVVGTSFNMFFTCLGAYVLSRKKFMFKKALTLMIVFTMYFSGGLIPNFMLIRGLHLYNTRLALLLPGVIYTFNLIVMRTAFVQIPDSLVESAKLDGANDFIILFKIILPVAKATLSVMVLFYAVGHWNAWFNAMVYLQDRSKFPLQLLLREILLANSSSGNTASAASGEQGIFLLDELIKHCTIVISTVPILCIYPFVQKHFTKGVMMGSVKE